MYIYIYICTLIHDSLEIAHIIYHISNSYVMLLQSSIYLTCISIIISTFKFQVYPPVVQHGVLETMDHRNQ